MNTYTFFPDLLTQITAPQPDSITSRTLYQDAHFKAVLFSFAAGQELSEHTATIPAIIHILQGDATLTLGSDTMRVGPGAWASMPANLPHSIHAHSPTYMLLLMLKQSAA